MFPLIKKEFNLFFGSPTGYFVIGSFLILNGLLLWFFENNLNILDAGFSDLNSFFYINPWLFVLLIPALTMGSLSDEFSFGTIEILKTKPISNLQLIGGKFLAILLIVIIALMPTSTYVCSIYFLATPVGNIDFGVLIGSFIGLIFIASTFISIGLWVSTFSKNQLIVLLGTIAVSFFFFYGIQGLSSLFTKDSYKIQQWGMYAHFISIGRGVLDTRDLIYFCNISIFFLVATYLKMLRKQRWKYWIYTFIILIGLHKIGSNFYGRFDLTSDSRYTLSKTSLSILNDIKEQVVIKVYLDGDFPAEFERLKLETQQLLRELKTKNKKLKILFIDPKENLEEHIKNGLTPSRLTVEKDGVISETIILPWATVQYKNKRELVSLLKNSNPLESQEKQLENSIQNMEYAFVDALKKVNSKKEKSIAILTGNGQLEDVYLFQFLKSLVPYYYLAKFTLDSVSKNPYKTLKQLNKYDLIILAKPTQPFTEEEKYILDQYTLQGGNSMWMIDYVHAEIDSLFVSGKTLAYPRNLNLDDLFFRYGVRFNQDIVKDLYASRIPLITGNVGNKPTFQSFLWFYYPLVSPNSVHPVVNNLAPVSFKFVSSIDTLKSDIKKTVLLKSSVLSKIVKTPNFIELKSVAEQPDQRNYNQGSKILALLLEGKFISAYKDRLKPLKLTTNLERGTDSKMILIADGDIARNEIVNEKPLELGVDKWTKELYGNKEFLLNSVDYLLDDTGLISVRSKSLSMRILDKHKIAKARSYWELINLIFPLILLTIFGLGFIFYRKQKYGRVIKN